MEQTQHNIIDDAELDAAVERYKLAIGDDAATVSGRLEYGILHRGVLHYNFSLHLPTIAEDIALDPALEGVPRLLAVYAGALDSLGAMPPDDLEQIDGAWLGAHLVNSDFDALYYAQALLEKKRRSGSARVI